VAIKVLRPELSRDTDVKHFLREIDHTAKLTHPHIVPVLDSGATDGPLYYYVMPYLDGGTLRHRLTRGRIPLAEAVEIATTVAHALDYAHRHGLIHRDVKPENILFTERDPWLADFGIARALDRVRDATWSSIGVARGTAAYMSPEQVRAAEQLDARTDVYSLACVLYEMLAGQPPFLGRTNQVTFRRQLHDPPPPLRVARPEVPPSVERAIVRALAKDPAARPATAAAFAGELAEGDGAME
jgi:serine/threonine-protein kinase